MKVSNDALTERVYSNPLYNVYTSMKKRCYTKSTSGYENYGGKGIKVCDEWRNDFIAFKNWAIANGYFYDTSAAHRDVMSVDRIDPTKDYCPENCRIIPLHENVARAARGAIFTKERREKISAALKGKTLSEETKQKLSDAHKGKGLENTHALKGYYIMYDGDKKITFQRQAKITDYFQKEYNKVVSLANINMAANKKRKTAYGRKWEYVKYDCQ